MNRKYQIIKLKEYKAYLLSLKEERKSDKEEKTINNVKVKKLGKHPLAN